MDVVLTPIGFVRSDRSDPVDDYWGGTVSVIELDSTMLEPSATLGLEQFSHVEVVFLMHQVAPEAVVTGAPSPVFSLKGRKPGRIALGYLERGCAACRD